MTFDKTACIVKCTVFINMGAGNFPNLSPKSDLLYLKRKIIMPSAKDSKHEKDKQQIGETDKWVLIRLITHSVKHVLEVYHTSM